MSDRRRRARLQDIASIAEALREPVETPDLTSSILERVHAERPFVDSRTRQWVPVVRVGAAAMAALTVFAVTLIIFVKPTLPEQLGAAPSVTTELFNSTEQGVTTSVAELVQGMKQLKEAADPRRLMVAEAPVVAAAPASLLVERRVEPASEPMRLVVTTVSLPLPAPVPVALPTMAPMVAGGWGVHPVSFDQVGIDQAAIYRTLRAGPDRLDNTNNLGVAHRAGMVSQYKTHMASFTMPLTSPKPGALNPGSPALVQDLVDLITGQRSGDEQVIR